MTTMRRLGAGALCATALALAAAAPAAAFPPVGTAVTGEADTRGFDFGALATCRLTLGGQVTGHEMFGGGTIRLDRLAFTDCSNGATVTANSLPWTLGTAPSLAAAFYPTDVNITTARATCRYAGSMQGWTNGTGTWFLNGDVFRRTAGCGRVDQLRTRVTLSLRDSDGRPVGL